MVVVRFPQQTNFGPIGPPPKSSDDRGTKSQGSASKYAGFDTKDFDDKYKGFDAKPNTAGVNASSSNEESEAGARGGRGGGAPLNLFETLEDYCDKSKPGDNDEHTEVDGSNDDE